jgi:hypothetical protein
MTGVPPFEAPACQTIPILTDEVTDGLLARATGASGTVTITAPFPAADYADKP